MQWAYLCPAANFVADGERQGTYALGSEKLFFNSNGESQISYEDYAIAMVDEAENGKHIQKRFTVVGE